MVTPAFFTVAAEFFSGAIGALKCGQLPEARKLK
jgi:hypothetical protein